MTIRGMISGFKSGVLFSAIFFFVPPLQSSLSWASGTVSDDECLSSLNAIYAPHPPIEGPYLYKMRIEKTGSISVGDPWYQFVIEIFDKVNGGLKTQMVLPYNCSQSGAQVCHVWYSVKGGNREEQVKDFGVFALSKEGMRATDIVTPDQIGVAEVPYLILFPGFSSKAHYTNWGQSTIPNVTYHSDDKVLPVGIEVWRLLECKGQE